MIWSLSHRAWQRPSEARTSAPNWDVDQRFLKVEKRAADAARPRVLSLVIGRFIFVTLHPEDRYLAKKQKPALNVVFHLADLMPHYIYSTHTAPSVDSIARDQGEVSHDRKSHMPNLQVRG